MPFYEPHDGGWQPIKTAPKDGTDVLLWTDAESIVLGRWTGSYWFNGDVTEFLFGAPTHWMPLPEPPKEG